MGRGETVKFGKNWFFKQMGFDGNDRVFRKVDKRLKESLKPLSDQLCGRYYRFLGLEVFNSNNPFMIYCKRNAQASFLAFKILNMISNLSLIRQNF